MTALFLNWAEPQTHFFYAAEPLAGFKVSLIFCASAATATQAQLAPLLLGSAQPESAIVRIFSTSRQPDLYRPWNEAARNESTGSSVVIEGNRILTNAHVVNCTNKVEVREAVLAYGYQLGGNSLSITKGIFSHIEFVSYSFFQNPK